MKQKIYTQLQEQKEHGRPDFLFNIYPCTIPLDFPEVSVHWHDDIEFISVRKGSGVVELDFIPYEVNHGDLILIRPGQLHAIKAHPQGSMEYENIMLHDSFFMSYHLDACVQEYFIPFMEGKYELPAIYRKDDYCYGPLMECISRVDALSSTKEFAWEVGVKSTIYHFFYVLFARHPFKQVKQSDIKKETALKEILTYVDENYTHSITVEEAARQLGYSESHFMRFFKQQTHMTFVSYVNELRLAKAAEMLRNTSDSILEISGNVGYENLSLFNRQFKRKYQMTPSSYRGI